jgi:hypothetical protein
MVTAATHSSVSNAGAQYILNREVDVNQMLIAGAAGMPAASITRNARLLGAGELEAHALGTFGGTSLDYLANGVIERWNDPVTGGMMCYAP